MQFLYASTQPYFLSRYLPYLSIQIPGTYVLFKSYTYYYIGSTSTGKKGEERFRMSALLFLRDTQCAMYVT